MLSTLAGWHSMRFSATSAAAVTCASMKPEFTPLSGARNARQAAHLRIHQQRDAPLGDRADFRAGEREDVRRKRHRLGVEIAAREHFGRSRGRSSGLSVTALASVSSVPACCVIRSRHAPMTCGWQRSEYGSCTRVAGAMRFADLTAREQLAIDLRDARLAVVAAHVVNARIKRRIAALQGIKRQRAADHRGRRTPSPARRAPPARARWTPACRSAARGPPSVRAASGVRPSCASASAAGTISPCRRMLPEPQQRK